MPNLDSRLTNIERAFFEKMAPRYGYAPVSETIDIVKRILEAVDGAIREARLPPTTEAWLRQDIARRVGEWHLPKERNEDDSQATASPAHHGQGMDNGQALDS
jgi:hypothetical protein